MAAGVVPQSSCSFRPQAPARICSSSGPGRLLLPLPRKPRLIGNPSAACSMRSRFQAPGVQVVALVPVAGPVPPPSSVVRPAARAVSTSCGQMKWTWRVDAAGRDDQVLAGDDLGAGADHQLRIDAGLDQRIARLADADDPAVADADVALDDAPVVEDDGVGDDQVERRLAPACRAAAIGPGCRG